LGGSRFGSVGAGRAGVAGGAAPRGRSGRASGWTPRRGPLGADLAVRRKHGREFAGTEVREKTDEGVEDAQQGQPDSGQEHPVNPALVPPRLDALAQAAEGALQAVVGVKGEGVGHSGILVWMIFVL
jgi:hypothetical protein